MHQRTTAIASSVLGLLLTLAAAPATAETPAAGAPAASADAAPATAEAPAPTDDLADADALRREYLALRDELFASRARVAAVASQLYSTKVMLHLAWTTGRYQGISQASIRLDGATVYSDDAGGIATDDAVRFEGYLAPGAHVITYAIEAAAKDDDRFTTTTETTISIQAVAGKDLIVKATARDEGDIGYQWARGERGTYRIGLAVDVRTGAPRATRAAATAGGKPMARAIPRLPRRPDAVAALY
jgi:hypothetical protein